MVEPIEAARDPRVGPLPGDYLSKSTNMGRTSARYVVDVETLAVSFRVVRINPRTHAIGSEFSNGVVVVKIATWRRWARDATPGVLPESLRAAAEQALL